MLLRRPIALTTRSFRGLSGGLPQRQASGALSGHPAARPRPPLRARAAQTLHAQQRSALRRDGAAAAVGAESGSPPPPGAGGAPQQQQLAPQQEFRIVYRNPYIRPLQILCRLKIYQTAFTVATIPFVAFLIRFEDLDPVAGTQIVCLSGVAVVFLGIFGELFRRFVGILYINNSYETVKIAHLTFWGKRADEVVPVSDIIPLSESSDSTSMPVWRLQRYSRGNKVFLIPSTHFGGIEDPEAIRAIFGSTGDREG